MGGKTQGDTIMQLFAALAFVMVLVAAVLLVATMLRGEAARLVAILSGEELARARTPRPVVVSATARRRPLPARAAAPSRAPRHAAAA